MERKPVISSNIRNIGYDPLTSDIEIEFKSGAVYRYYGVPAELYHEMIAAESVGRYFSQAVKPRFAFERIDKVEAA